MKLLIGRHRLSVAVTAWLATMPAVGAEGLPKDAPFDVRRFASVSGSPAAGETKTAVCAACHGTDGNAVAPIFPSLAAQSANYTYLQLRSFKSNWRTSPIMQPLVGTLSDQDARDLAAFYAKQRRRPAMPAGLPEEIARGKLLYLEGDRGLGIPPCQGCHGSDGAGLARVGSGGKRLLNDTTYPAVAGLSRDYVVAQLEAFRKGERAGTTNARIMQGVAHTLDAESSAALGAYLATLAIE